MTSANRSIAWPLWTPGTRVHVTHSRAEGTVVSNTTDAMAPLLSALGFVGDGPGRWRLPASRHCPVDLDLIDALVDGLRHRHQVAVSTRLHPDAVDGSHQTWRFTPPSIE